MSATMTAVGHRAGYLPPEGRGSESGDSDEDDDEDDDKVRYSHRLDMYSFGAVATQTVQSANHLESRKDLKRAFKRIKDHPLKEMIARCLDKESKKRPEARDVYEFIDSIM